MIVKNLFNLRCLYNGEIYKVIAFSESKLVLEDELGGQLSLDSRDFDLYTLYEFDASSRGVAYFYYDIEKALRIVYFDKHMNRKEAQVEGALLDYFKKNRNRLDYPAKIVLSKGEEFYNLLDSYFEDIIEQRAMKERGDL